MTQQNGKPKAYVTEFSVGLASARWVAMTASDLATRQPLGEPYQEISTHCHIYAICRCPNFAFDPDDFRFERGAVRGRLSYRIEGKQHFLPFELPFELTDGAVGVRVTPYPHRDFETVDAKGAAVRYVPARVIAMNDRKFRELEVLYIGQAYAEGRRSAFDRLREHATLQTILADSLQQNPDDNIYLMAFEYADPMMFIRFDGINKNAIGGEEDDRRLNNLREKLGMSKHHQICLAEAGLIRYFQPRYNQVYKESFPASDQKILAECLELDFAALVVEIDTEELDFLLYSPSVKKAGHHTAKFDLVDPAVRQSFFTFIDRDGKEYKYPDVIPRSR